MAIFQETKIKFSILVTVTFLFFCIGVIPLVFSNWKLYSINKKELESALRESFVNTASTVSSRIADQIKTYRDMVREFSPKALARIEGGTESGLSSESQVLMKDPNILKIRVLNTEGKGSWAGKITFQDPKIADLELEAFSEALEGTSHVGSPYYDSMDEIPVLLLAEPLRTTKGEIVGVLSAIVSLEPMLDMITEQSAGGTQVYIIDSDGNLLLHPNRSRMAARPNLANSEIVKSFKDTKGRVSSVRSYFENEEDGKTIQIMGSYSAIPNSNWGLIIQIEKEIAFSSLRAMFRESVKWAVIFAVAAALIGAYLARRISNPIQVLAQHALDVGRHQNFDKRIDIRAGNEIRQLGDTFNYMTAEIKQNIVSLQNAARENKELFMSSIRMLAAAIDAKDPYTRGHSERVKDYAMVIAKEMGFNAEELERVEICALLHDVGKIGIEDRILRKPTNLTPEEFEIMKTHPDKGANILAQIAQLSDIIPGMRAHHENYDGSGYPQGLKGEEIPLLGRLITVADTFDAMTTDRPYQKAFTLEFALNRIRTMMNVKYDPKIVNAFGRACEEGKVTLHKPSRPKPKPAVPAATAPTQQTPLG